MNGSASEGLDALLEMPRSARVGGDPACKEQYEDGEGCVQFQHMFDALEKGPDNYKEEKEFGFKRLMDDLEKFVSI